MGTSSIKESKVDVPTDDDISESSASFAGSLLLDKDGR
jgi:hypothetical protein